MLRRVCFCSRAVFFCLSFLGFSLFSQVGLAENANIIGTAYPIAETDFLEWVQYTLSDSAHQQALANLQSKKIQTLHAYSERPDRVTGLSPALETKSWVYDPSITLTQPVLDAEGQVRHPVGSQFNPLSTVVWQKTLLFFDADDPKQIAWAMAQQKKEPAVMVILIGGSLSETSKALGQKVYFDQGGILVHRLGIQHVPAWVKQVGQKLQITEVKLEAG